MPRLWLPAILAAWLALPPAPAAASAPVPPLDCRGERAAETGAIERLVCRDAGLAALDREVDRLYRLARAAGTGRVPAALDESQQAWRLRRGDCRNAIDLAPCLRAIHLDRIAALRLHHAAARSADADGMSRGPVAFDCAGRTLTVTFVAGAPAMAHLRWRGAGYAAVQVESGSGARYRGPDGAEIWTKGSDAAVALPDGTKLDCRELRRQG